MDCGRLKTVTLIFPTRTPEALESGIRLAFEPGRRLDQGFILRVNPSPSIYRQLYDVLGQGCGTPRRLKLVSVTGKKEMVVFNPRVTHAIRDSDTYHVTVESIL